MGRELAFSLLQRLWRGLPLGVSFLATPTKFLAPCLTLPVALDVGRHTFSAFNKVEWLLSIVLLLLVWVSPRSWLIRVSAIVAVLVVLVETVWLLPLLDHRVGLTIADQPLSASNQHNFDIAVEVAKLIALGTVTAITARRLVHQSTDC